MSYADVVNDAAVSRWTGQGKPAHPARGVWMREVFHNEHYDGVTHTRSGPAFAIDGGEAVYTYTLTLRTDAAERYKAKLRGIIFDEQDRRENSGRVIDGLDIPTTDGALAKARASVDDLQATPGASRKFNTRSGRAIVTAEVSTALLQAIIDHKQAANDWGYGQSELLDDAVTLDELRAFEAVLISEIS